jgi:hypothetical protein
MKTLFTFLAIVASVVIFSSFGGDENSDYPNGSPGGYTGSPGDGKNCKNCHGGSYSTVSGWITSDIPAAGYTPGSSYTITVTLTGSGNKGFECSPQNSSGGLLGTLTAGSGQHLVNGSKAVTHSSKKTSNPATWTFTWTAPAAGTGDVTFYGAFTVTKSVTKLSTLTVSESSPAPLTVTATATPSSICSGSTSQLSASAAGGGGSYTYSWTSIPSGYTSTSQNPVVQPTLSTQYIVVVSDGTNSVSDTTEVAVTQPPTSFAGNDTTCNVNITQIQLQGQATNYSSILWSSSGDGTFSNSGMLDAIYYPGNGDKSTGWVNLYLTAHPNSPCSANAASAMTVTFAPNVGLTDQQSGEPQLFLSPNPTNGIIHINRTGKKGLECMITVFDIRGKIVLSEALSMDGTNSCTVDISGNPRGLYLIRLTTDLESVDKKIILN